MLCYAMLCYAMLCYAMLLVYMQNCPPKLLVLSFWLYLMLLLIMIDNGVLVLLLIQCQMRLIKLWIWILPIVFIATLIVNVYFLSYLHGSKCKYRSVKKVSILTRDANQTGWALLWMWSFLSFNQRWWIWFLNTCQHWFCQLSSFCVTVLWKWNSINFFTWYLNYFSV